MATVEEAVRVDPSLWGGGGAGAVDLSRTVPSGSSRGDTQRGGYRDTPSPSPASSARVSLPGVALPPCRSNGSARSSNSSGGSGNSSSTRSSGAASLSPNASSRSTRRVNRGSAWRNSGSSAAPNTGARFLQANQPRAPSGASASGWRRVGASTVVPVSPTAGDSAMAGLARSPPLSTLGTMQALFCPPPCLAGLVSWLVQYFSLVTSVWDSSRSHSVARPAGSTEGAPAGTSASAIVRTVAVPCPGPPSAASASAEDLTSSTPLSRAHGRAALQGQAPPQAVRSGTAETQAVPGAVEEAMLPLLGTQQQSGHICASPVSSPSCSSISSTASTASSSSSRASSTVGGFAGRGPGSSIASSPDRSPYRSVGFEHKAQMKDELGVPGGGPESSLVGSGGLIHDKSRLAHTATEPEGDNFVQSPWPAWAQNGSGVHRSSSGSTGVGGGERRAQESGEQGQGNTVRVMGFAEAGTAGDACPGNGTGPASTASVNLSPWANHDEDDDHCCPTCLEEYTPANPQIDTECGHHFHLGCIYEWMERSPLCPVCMRTMAFKESAL